MQQVQRLTFSEIMVKSSDFQNSQSTILSDLLAKDTPIVIEGLGHSMKCMSWTVNELQQSYSHIPFQITKTTEQVHIPGAGTLKTMTIPQLLHKIEKLQRTNNHSTRYYLSGSNLISSKKSDEELNDDQEFLHSKALPIIHNQPYEPLHDDLASDTAKSELEQLQNDCQDFTQFIMNELTHHEELSSLGIWLGHDQQKTWLHFDCAHNLMLQIRGKKTFLLASPSHYLDLYPYTFKTCKGQDMKGEIYRFSEVNAWKPQLDQYPRSGRVQFLEAPLERGDGLLLPMGWWHAVLSEGERASSCEDDASSCCCCGFNIALNAFWDADESFWAKRNHLKSFRKTYK